MLKIRHYFLLVVQVMYVTATSPYLLMLILLIRGCTLDGAGDGIKFYLIPKWEKLLEAQVGPHVKLCVKSPSKLDSKSSFREIDYN